MKIIMINKAFFLIIGFLLSYIVTFSQNKTDLAYNEFFSVHYYTFKGINAPAKLEAMEIELNNLAMVSEAKVKFKPEKNQGQIVLVVKEKQIVNEGDKSFSPTSIKQTILKSGFSPMEYSIGEYQRK